MDDSIVSYYTATAHPAPSTTSLRGEHRTQVAIVGGGFTGLGAARELARAGVPCAVLEAETLGFGASGRNGGQAHVGMRRDQIWLERVVGKADARRLWDMALEAYADVRRVISDDTIACDFTLGHLHLDHKPQFVAETHAYVRHLNEVYDYPHIRCVGRDEARALVDCSGYYGGALDAEGGHLHPLNLTLGLAHAAQRAGAALFTHSRATQLTRSGGGWRVETAGGVVIADQVILGGDGTLNGLNKTLDAHVMPINNFIAVTAPLPPAQLSALIADKRAVSDSRFVVYYFRPTADNRLLFGGGENYSYTFPKDIAAFVRPHIARIFPAMRDVPIDYAWGGALGITANRMPYVREVAPGVITAAGYSGLGVILAPYFGKILAQSIIGNRRDFEQLVKLPAMRFPGGRALRWPTMVAAMSIFALRDRL